MSPRKRGMRSGNTAVSAKSMGRKVRRKDVVVGGERCTGNLPLRGLAAGREGDVEQEDECCEMLWWLVEMSGERMFSSDGEIEEKRE